MEIMLYYGILAQNRTNGVRDKNNHKMDRKWAITIIVFAVVFTLLAIWFLPS